MCPLAASDDADCDPVVWCRRARPKAEDGTIIGA